MIFIKSQPHKNSLKKIRDILNTLYIKLNHGKDPRAESSQTSDSRNDASIEVAGLYTGDSDIEYFPYVSFAFKWEIS